MPRVSVSLFGVFVTVVALGVPAQGAISAPVPPRDSVVGGGATVSGLFGNIGINVQSEALGGNPSGAISFLVFFTGGVAVIGGPVTCLAVDGNHAVIGFVDESVGLGPVSVVVSDNGPAGSSTPDGFNAFPGSTDCLTDPGLSTLPLLGDIVVRDAPSKAQCLDGGWRNYTDAAGQPLKNQGECIAFALGVA